MAQMGDFVGTWGLTTANATWVNTTSFGSPWQAVTSSPTKLEKRKNMRGLFEVFIVDPETASLIAHEHVVANDERTAQLKGAMDAKLGDVDDYDFIVRRLGDVRPKKKAKSA